MLLNNLLPDIPKFWKGSQGKERSFEGEAKHIPKGRERSLRVNVVKVGFANADTYIIIIINYYIINYILIIILMKGKRNSAVNPGRGQNFQKGTHGPPCILTLHHLNLI